MKYGCGRVSTDDQSPALQLAALKEGRMQNHFQRRRFIGRDDEAPCCLKKLEHGDTLIVWKLDRLGRSLRDLITMLDDLRAPGVKFGRKPKLSRQQIDHAKRLLARKRPPSRDEIAALFKVNRSTLYRALET